MALSLEIELRDYATPVMNRIAGLDLTKLNSEVGGAVANVVKAHLFQLNSERANALGGKRTNFYSQAAKGTHYQAAATGATVSVNQVGFQQRLKGGEIKPVKAKYLTIPVIAEAYGKRAREFSDLQVIYDRRGKPVALAEKSFSKGKGKKAKSSPFGRVFFLLVQRVVQGPDRSVLPTDEKMAETALQTVGNFIGRIAGGTNV